MTDETIIGVYQEGLQSIINEAHDDMYTSTTNKNTPSQEEAIALEKIKKVLGISEDL